MSKSELVVKELGSTTLEDLNKKLVVFKKELFNLRFRKALGDLENTGRFSKVRKNIARIKTELTKRSKIGE